MTDLNDTINDLISDVMADEELHEDIKNQIVEMAKTVQDDPTAGNVEALGIVIDKLADMNKYLSAKATLEGLDLKQQVGEQVDAETPAEEAAAPAETPAQ